MRSLGATASRIVNAVSLLFACAVAGPALSLGGEELIAELKAERDAYKRQLDDVNARLGTFPAVEKLAVAGYDAEDVAYLRDETLVPWVHYFWTTSFAHDQVTGAGRRCPEEGETVPPAAPEFTSASQYFSVHLSKLNNGVALLETQYVDPLPSEVAPMAQAIPTLRSKLAEADDLLSQCYIGGWNREVARLRLDARNELTAYNEEVAALDVARRALDHDEFSRAQRAASRYFSAYEAAKKQAEEALCRLSHDCLAPMLALLGPPLFQDLPPLSRCERERRLYLRRADALLAQLQNERTVPLATLEAILVLLDDLGADRLPRGALAGANVSRAGLLGLLGEKAGSLSVGRGIELGVAEASEALLFGAALTSAELALLNYTIIGPLVGLYGKGVKDIVLKIAEWPQADENTEAYQWLVDGVERGTSRPVTPAIRNFLARHPDILKRATGQRPPVGGTDVQIANYLSANAEKLFLTFGYLEEKQGRPRFPRWDFDSFATNRYDVGYYRRALRDDIFRTLEDVRAEIDATVCD